MNFKILIVEDEEIIRLGLQDNFEMEGYTVETACDGEEAIAKADSYQPHLVLLDLMIPKKSGFEVCRYIRNKHPDTYIIMLTAKTEDMDKLIGFDQGADDYLTKPFNILELKARIRALLRRSSRDVPRTRITRGGITVDRSSRNAYKNGSLVDLTAKEFDLVELLIRHPNRVFSRENLLDTIWGDDYRSDIRTVDVHIRRIREKLENDPAAPEYIMTKWGVGYYFKA